MTTAPKQLLLPNELQHAVRLARFATEYKLDPADVAQLVLRANMAFKAGERDCNEGTERSSQLYERATDNFNALAHSLGFAVQWPGLWPTLFRDGRTIYDLPV